MYRMKKIVNTNPNAWVVSSKDRGRKSIKNGKVYLKDNEEFEIEIFNPLTVSILAKIKLNGNDISSSGLVISPGERIYLDCFIDDKKKFIFKTYHVENSQEALDAIKQNGLLEVTFFKEKTYFNNPNYWYSTTTNYPTYSQNSNSNIFTTNSTGSAFSTNGSNGTITTSNVLLNSLSANYIETGRIQKGESSDQKFESVYMDFENYQWSKTVIQILPDSNRPIYSSEIKNKNEKVDKTSYIDLLVKLNDLYKSGILTESEFSKKKEEILSKI